MKDEELWRASKRQFLEKWIIPNRSTLGQVAPLKIAIDCSEDIEQKLESLTASIEKASKSSTLIGIGLCVMGLATWALFILEICKFLRH